MVRGSYIYKGNGANRSIFKPSSRINPDISLLPLTMTSDRFEPTRFTVGSRRFGRRKIRAGVKGSPSCKTRFAVEVTVSPMRVLKSTMLNEGISGSQIFEHQNCLARAEGRRMTATGLQLSAQRSSATFRVSLFVPVWRAQVPWPRIPPSVFSCSYFLPVLCADCCLFHLVRSSRSRPVSTLDPYLLLLPSSPHAEKALD